jgi:hypothetical protein
MTNTTTQPTSRTFKLRSYIREGEEWGEIDTTETETLTVNPDGSMTIVSVVRGMHEGTRINQRHERVIPAGGPTLEKCAAYRLTYGYTEVK